MVGVLIKNGDQNNEQALRRIPSVSDVPKMVSLDVKGQANKDGLQNTCIRERHCTAFPTCSGGINLRIFSSQVIPPKPTRLSISTALEVCPLLQQLQQSNPVLGEVPHVP